MKTLALAIALVAVATTAHANHSQRLGVDAEYSCNEARSMSQRTYVNYGQASISPFMLAGLMPFTQLSGLYRQAMYAQTLATVKCLPK